MSEPWSVQSAVRVCRGESLLFRYGFALLLPLVITIVALNRPALGESSWFLFFGGVVLSACFGGLSPACVTAAFSILLIRLFFITPVFSLNLLANVSATEQMFVFVLFALAAACLVSSMRRQRDEAQQFLPVDLLADTDANPVMITDEQCRILFANRAAERLFGPRAIAGGHLDTVLPNHSFGHHLRAMHQDSRKQPLSLQISAPNSTAMDLTLATVVHHGRTLFAAVISDPVRQARSLAA